jgi:hypothetical protein
MHTLRPHSRRSTTGDLRRIPVHEIAVYGLALGGANFGWQWQRQDEVAASIGARVQGDGGTAVGFGFYPERLTYDATT